MSRLRTSSPWTTPTTSTGARILSQEPATIDAIPVMSVAEMEALLTAEVAPVARSARRADVARRVRGALALVAAVVVLAGCGTGLSLGTGWVGGPPAPAGATAAAPAESPVPALAAAWGEAMAVAAPVAPPVSAERSLLPPTVERAHVATDAVLPMASAGVVAPGSVLGAVAAGLVAPSAPPAHAA